MQVYGPYREPVGHPHGRVRVRVDLRHGMFSWKARNGQVSIYNMIFADACMRTGMRVSGCVRCAYLRKFAWWTFHRVQMRFRILRQTTFQIKTWSQIAIILEMWAQLQNRELSTNARNEPVPSWGAYQPLPTTNVKDERLLASHDSSAQTSSTLASIQWKYQYVQLSNSLRCQIASCSGKYRLYGGNSITKYFFDIACVLLHTQGPCNANICVNFVQFSYP